MQQINHHRLIILGSGPAGCTAAIYSARANIDAILISGSQPGGQLTTTNIVDNWPGETNGIEGFKLMDNMIKQVKRFEVPIKDEQILKVNLKSKPFHLYGEKEEYSCDALIIATGASAGALGLQSEQDFLGRGVSFCATCDGFFYRKMNVAVVGGGNTAIEDALYLSEIASCVTLIHRRNQLRADPILTKHLFDKEKEGKIKIEWNSVVVEILGDEKGVNGLTINNVKTLENKRIEAQGVFIAIGNKPNADIFREQLDLNEHNNYIKVKGGKESGATSTSISGVFAAGDVTEPTYRQAVVAAGFGCMAAIDAKKYLENNVGVQYFEPANNSNAAK